MFTSQISLEHAFHLMLNGYIEEAKCQLSIAENWRYGKESLAQHQKSKLIQAYRSLLDYIIWCDKKYNLPHIGKMPFIKCSCSMSHCHLMARSCNYKLQRELVICRKYTAFMCEIIPVLTLFSNAICFCIQMMLNQVKTKTLITTSDRPQ